MRNSRRVFLMVISLSLALHCGDAVFSQQEFTFLAPEVNEVYSGNSHTFEVDFELAQTAGPLVGTDSISGGVFHGDNEVEATNVELVGAGLDANACFVGMQGVARGFHVRRHLGGEPLFGQPAGLRSSVPRHAGNVHRHRAYRSSGDGAPELREHAGAPPSCSSLW